MTITSAQAAIDDVIDRIRSEAMIADRPGQLARLNAIADHLAELAAQPATAIDREPIAPAAERQHIADRLREIANTHDQQAAYMLSYDADFIREVAERISPELASGVLNGQKEN